MLARWLSYFSFVCFGILTLVALHMTRKPLCIDSRVVERIDRTGAFSTDSIYRCAINREVKFSVFFNDKSREISQRLTSLERFLENLEPFARKIRITIFEDRPQTFRVQDHQVFIGQALFAEPGMLEKAIAKVWYREKSNSFFINQSLLEEVVTDFLIYGATSHTAASLAMPKWPYMIKSLQDYCDSAWKFPEHIRFCNSQTLEDATEYSLRPLLTSTWINAYRDLSILEKGNFLRNFSAMLKDEHTPSLPIFRSNNLGVVNSPLFEAAEVVRNINSYIATSRVMRTSLAYREFMGNLNAELNKAGFKDTFTEAYFDVLLVSEKVLSEKSATYLHFKDVSRANPKLHIALKDPENVWSMPTRYPISLKAFGQMRSDRTIVEKCGQVDFSFVLTFAQLTEKLLVVDTCDQTNSVKYSEYFKSGAEGFAKENKGIAFIQFHVPSIVMKRSQLATVPNIYEMVQNREANNPLFQTLGWQEVHWNKTAKAYRPKAFIDAIELFRIPEKTH